MTERELITAILEGRDVRRAIWERNARLSLGIAEAIAKNKHPANTCKVQHCPHGSEFLVRSHIEHAATLQAEMLEFP